MFRLKALAAFTLLMVGALACADTGSIRVNLFPQMAVADAKSTVTVSAEVRESNGRAAPNGTRVLFQTTLGHFQEATVNVSNGFARAILVTGDTPGTAKITVNAISLSATTTTELEMVANRSELSTARSYVDVQAPKSLLYSMDYQVLSANGLDHGVVVDCGPFKIQADDVQIDVGAQQLRARRAKVTVHGDTHDFQDLLLNLRERKGVGTSSYTAQVLSDISVAGHWVELKSKPATRFGLVELTASGTVRPLPADAPRPKFDFADLSDSATLVNARRALIFPSREIQFQRAEVAVNGSKIIKLPLYRMDLTNPSMGFGDQILTLNDNRLGVNYPYYLSLGAKQTSLIRFRTGQAAGRTLTGNSGTFLDYEWTWNQGEASEGGLTLTGFNRQDWSLDARHSLHFGDGSSVAAMLSSPARRSIFGSLSYTKPMKGMQFSLNGSSSRALAGTSADTQQVGMVLESDPQKMRSIPLTLYYGLTATDSSSRFADIQRSSRTAGLRMRGQFATLDIDHSTHLASSFSIGNRWGANGGLALYGSLGLSRAMRWGSLNLNYDYANDNSLASTAALGSQRLSLESEYGVGRTNLHMFASKSLDADWSSVYGDLSYRLSGLYRLSAGYTMDQFLGERNLDYNMVLSYRLGLRDLGLTWSRRTNRIGFEVLGARF